MNFSLRQAVILLIAYFACLQVEQRRVLYRSPIVGVHELVQYNAGVAVSVLIGEVMKFFVLLGLAMASAFCMSHTTLPETEKALEKKPGSGEIAPAQTSPKTGFEQALPSLLDDQFAWDQFKHRTTLIWACRGTKTGKIVANSYCASQPMVDSRWPDKNTPGDYRGVLTY